MSCRSQQMTSIPFKTETISIVFNFITVFHSASPAFINASELTRADPLLCNQTTTRKMFVTKDTRREYDFLYSDQSCEFLARTRAPFSKEIQLKHILATFDSEDGGMVLDIPKRNSTELRAPTLPESIFYDFQCESIDSGDKECDSETQKEGMFSSRHASANPVKMRKGRKYDILNDIHIKTELHNSTDKSVDTDALKNVIKLFGSNERLVVGSNKSVVRHKGKEPTLPAVIFDSELQVSHIEQSDETETHSSFQPQKVYSKVENSDATVDRTEEESKKIDTKSESNIFDISSLLNHRKPPLTPPISNEHDLKDLKSQSKSSTANKLRFNGYGMEKIIKNTTPNELNILERRTSTNNKKGVHTMQPKTHSIKFRLEKTLKNNDFKESNSKAIKAKKLTRNADIPSTKQRGRPRKTTDVVISLNMKTIRQQPTGFQKTTKNIEKNTYIDTETVEVSSIQSTQVQSDEVQNQRVNMNDEFIFKEKTRFSLQATTFFRHSTKTTVEPEDVNSYNKKKMPNASVFCTLDDSGETDDLSGFTVEPILDSNMFHDLDEYIATRRKTKTTTESLKPLRNIDDKLQHIKELCSEYGKMLVTKKESRKNVSSNNPEKINRTWVNEDEYDLNETSKAEVEEVPIIDFQDPFQIIEHKRRQSQHPWNFKIGSWNVNGIRAWSQKNGFSFLQEHDLDVFCVQEVRCPQEKLPPCPPGYHSFWFPGTKQGYAGVAVLSKRKPLSVAEGFLSDHEEDIDDGRVLTVEFEQFYLTNVYAPASKQDLSMLPLKLKWNALLRNHVVKLNETKPVVVAGDLNVAHQPIDVALPLTNSGRSGFTAQERDDFSQLLAVGFIDTYRHLYPDRHSFTYWPYYERPAKPNGWRLDYFLISSQLQSRLSDQEIHCDKEGSDHSPLILYLKI